MTRYGILTMMSEIVFLPVVQCLAQRSPVALIIPHDISTTAIPIGWIIFWGKLWYQCDLHPDL